MIDFLLKVLRLPRPLVCGLQRFGNLNTRDRNRANSQEVGICTFTENFATRDVAIMFMTDPRTFCARVTHSHRMVLLKSPVQRQTGVLVVTGSHNREIGDRPKEREIKCALLGRTVLAHKTRAINCEYYGEILKANIVTNSLLISSSLIRPVPKLLTLIDTGWATPMA